MNLCKDCKHIVPTSRYRMIPLCAHPNVLSRVTGGAFLSCETVRGDDKFCGRDGRWFDRADAPRQKRGVWQMIRGWL